jgi:CubicO group peptidase (beta-lactamase class C family)
MLVNRGRPILSEAAFSTMSRNQTAHLNMARTLGFWCRENGDFFGGDLPSISSFGHTGFTGTSICIDPKRRAFAVLLTNRVHPSRKNKKIIHYRKLFHNAVWADISNSVAAGINYD